MSCCGKQYCQFEFPPGPPLTDAPVASLEARYLFLPYGTLLAEGEVVRIWTEAGKTKSVVLEHKWPLNERNGQLVLADDGQKEGASVPWQLVAMDTGMEEGELRNWPQHPLHNPDTQPVILVFNHPITPKPSLKMRWLGFLYWLRNL
jgi:hypothetical protein